MYKANVISIGKLFVEINFRLDLCKLKKISNTSSTSHSLQVIKDKNGQHLFSLSNLLQRCAEHYKLLASDETGHCLNRYYWNATFPHTNSTT